MVIVVPTHPTASHPCPFGVARILRAGDAPTDFDWQWLGNATASLRGRYLPCWYDNANHTFYHAHRRQAGTTKADHPPYDAHVSGNNLQPSNIILAGFDLLDDDDRLTNEAWDIISANRFVADAIA